MLAIAFAHAYAQAFHGGIFLIIEEPEAHLHPIMQRWLSRRIHSMSSEGLQILITTHSPAFVDLLNLEGLVLARRVILVHTRYSTLQKIWSITASALEFRPKEWMPITFSLSTRLMLPKSF